MTLKRAGSPHRSIGRTFHAVFEMPVIPFNHNLIKVSKRQYRNPIYLAREWRRALDSGEYASRTVLARYLKVSKTRVTQIMNLLKLSPEVIEIISLLGDPLRNPVVSERRLRPLLNLTDNKQLTQIKTMLLKKGHDLS